MQINFLSFFKPGPGLPSGSKEAIRAVTSEVLPELIHGTTGYAQSGPYRIWYEDMNQQGGKKGTILLVMGHASTAMMWTPSFCQEYIDAGYRVIRYDNRDVGMSSWVENWDEAAPYTLEDMAVDGMAVLDNLNIDRVHLVGVSMGGMIAQRMALDYPARILTLTSIMSTGYMMDPELPAISERFTTNFIKLGVKYLLMGRDTGYVKFYLGVEHLLKGDGDYELDLKWSVHRTMYEIRRRNGFNKKAAKQQAAAIVASGSRLGELGNIKAPTLIIHGKSDPLILMDHALKYAPLIPHAKTLYIDGMGHDIARQYLGKVHEGILRNLEERVV